MSPGKVRLLQSKWRYKGFGIVQSFVTNFALTTSLGDSLSSVNSKPSWLAFSVSSTIFFFVVVGDRYPSSLQVISSGTFQFLTWVSFSAKPAIPFHINFLYFVTTFPALASHSCSKTNSFHGRRGIRILTNLSMKPPAKIPSRKRERL